MLGVLYLKMLSSACIDLKTLQQGVENELRLKLDAGEAVPEMIDPDLYVAMTLRLLLLEGASELVPMRGTFWKYQVRQRGDAGVLAARTDKEALQECLLEALLRHVHIVVSSTRGATRMNAHIALARPFNAGASPPIRRRTL